jgi:carbamoyltransferase
VKGPLLGIVDGISDAGAALFVDGRLVAAVNEERLTREKLEGGFPARSIEEVLRLGGCAAGDVVTVAVGGILTPSAATRLFRGLQRRLAPTAGIVFVPPAPPLVRLADLARYRLKLTTNRPGSPLGKAESLLARRALRRDLGRAFARAELALVDHHEAHARTAFHASPFGRALVVTADSLGDGCSLTVSRGEGGRLERLHAEGPFVSFGTFYALVTRWLGFLPYRHEGKVAALAAAGDAARVGVPFPLRLERGRLVYDGAWGLRAWRWLARLEGCAREDVAAWLQRGTERGLVDVVSRFVAATGTRDLCLAGGLFANVALNRVLLEEAGVDRLFVYPHMGDGGLAVGAGLAVLRPEGWALPPLFLGPAVDDARCRAALAGVPCERPEDPEAEVARLLARGLVVGRCVGRMEYGPRALGHRSVLAEARDPRVRDVLNRRLGRTEFMPFAPVTLERGAAERLDGLARARDCARHMTLAFRALPALVAEAPGAIHLDGTARCQVATPAEHPGLHRILEEYARRTGRATLVNTSFNRHEEPIVCTAEEAVATFRRGGLDALQLGPYLALSPALDRRLAAPAGRTA